MDFNTTRLLVFMLTFVSYALFHVSRKTLSGVKTSIADDWTKYNHFVPSRSEAQNFLGVLDSVFMGAYAIALFFWGWLGDRLNPRNVVVFGMITSSLFLVAFACLPKIFHFYSSSYYLITYFLFGVFQACGWPNEIAIMVSFSLLQNKLG
ncbi:hypothetical protein AB6A40_002363 [Gnathostoma spinigerum]|uniref:Major facilitator superfamily (MFS) profile domain-containing protein n=1 Tax=Gnathostoma spinigerum TaxID=75299 RepID=A0ABD6EBY2_9BILA